MIGLDVSGLSPTFEAVGLALVHFGWQGAVIGIVLFSILGWMAESPPQHRYIICCGAMLLMMVAPVTTTCLILLEPETPFHGPPVGFLSQQTALSGDGWLRPLLPWITSVWMIGSGFLQARLLYAWFSAERVKSVCVRALPDWWQQELDEIRGKLRISRAVKIVESRLVNVPSVVGWLRPVILVPAGLAAALTISQIRGIIAHELAHVRRCDYLVSILQGVFEALLFFHPVTWWLSGRLRQEREYCCDDIAVSFCDSPLSYTKALSSLEDLREPSLAVSVSLNGGSLMNRITRLLGRTGSPSARTPMAKWLAPLAVVGSALVFAAFIGTGCGQESAADVTAPAEGFEGVGEGLALAGAGEGDLLSKALRETCARGELSDGDCDRIGAKLRECGSGTGCESAGDGCSRSQCTSRDPSRCPDEGGAGLCKNLPDPESLQGASVEEIKLAFEGRLPAGATVDVLTTDDGQRCILVMCGSSGS